MGQTPEQDGTLALEQAIGPVAHIHQQVIASSVARAIEHLLEMAMARVKAMGFGGEAFGEVVGQAGAQETLGFLHHAWGDLFGQKQRVAFEDGLE